MTKIKFSANTGYLWQDRTFLDRIRLAKRYGFHSIEFHDEALKEDPVELKEVLSETELRVNSLNIRVGKTFGCAAIPDPADQAKQDIDQAIEIAEDIGSSAVHILAGITDDPRAGDAYRSALQYALKGTKLMVLIEPVCNKQLPGFYLRTIDQAGQVLTDINHSNLKIMFDCYHIQIIEGDLTRRITANLDIIGHVQFAGVPHRGRPDEGEISYRHVFAHLADLGYTAPLGAEYKPDDGDTDASLGWFSVLGDMPGSG